ncbi:TPA: hypothetical protein ACXEMS_000242 [Enterobacter ludwigii]
MKFTLKEMNGLLNGKCLPSDLIVGETLAEYLVRKFSELEQKLIESERYGRQTDITIDNLEMKLAQMAEENAGLKAAYPQPFGPVMMKALDAYEKHQDETPEIGMLDAFFILRDSIRADTTATDAFLAEVRAQGVDVAIEHLINKFEGTGRIGVPIMALEWLSKELRKGVRS